MHRERDREKKLSISDSSPVLLSEYLPVCHSICLHSVSCMSCLPFVEIKGATFYTTTGHFSLSLWEHHQLWFSWVYRCKLICHESLQTLFRWSGVMIKNLNEGGSVSTASIAAADARAVSDKAWTSNFWVPFFIAYPPESCWRCCFGALGIKSGEQHVSSGDRETVSVKEWEELSAHSSVCLWTTVYLCLCSYVSADTWMDNGVCVCVCLRCSLCFCW